MDTMEQYLADAVRALAGEGLSSFDKGAGSLFQLMKRQCAYLTIC